MITNLIIILSAVTGWGIGHSLLASHTVKRRLEPRFGRGYRLLYNLLAGLTFLPVLGLVGLLTDRQLYRVPEPWFWLMVVIQLAALCGAGITLLQTDILRFLGLRQLMTPDSLPQNRLTIAGAYAWVRHPLYFFSLLILWGNPVMTVNLLVFNLMCTGYFYIGAIFEERKLVSQFGPPYRAYQQQVPMLIPWRVR